MFENKSMLINSIDHINDLTIQKGAAEKNIAVQKRTLKLHQRDIDNHCCTCGGCHCSNDHVIHSKSDCKQMKMKQRVLTYLQQSLAESNLKLEQLNILLERGKQENRHAELKMNDSLISYIELSCAQALVVEE